MVNGQFPKAFTLVELLVVIAIIGVLATLITVAATAARQYVKVSLIKTEMGQIEMALEQYKTEFGEYPPDFTDSTAVYRHVKKRWPRFDLPGGSTQAAERVAQAMTSIYLASTVSTALAQCQPDISRNNLTFSTAARCVGALPFWLGGIPGSDGKFLGFSADPQAPFGRFSSGPNIGSTTTAADFDIGSMDKKTFMDLKLGVNVFFVTADKVNNETFPVLMQSSGSGEGLPYIYFRGRSTGGGEAYVVQDPWNTATSLLPKYYPLSKFFSSASVDDVVVAYARSGDPFNATAAQQTPVVWYESERYQLIHPGLDGKFGGIGNSSSSTGPFDSKYFKTTSDTATGNNLGQQDMDNIVNFSGQGATIKSLLP